MRIALDSNIFIYALANHAVWGKPAYEVLEMLESHDVMGVASTICLAEVIAKPAVASPELAEDAQLFMEGLIGIDYAAVDLEISIVASRLRGRYGPKLSTLDAMHLATALVQKADYFVTNDHGLLKLKLPGLKIHLLGEPLPV